MAEGHKRFDLSTHQSFVELVDLGKDIISMKKHIVDLKSCTKASDGHGASIIAALERSVVLMEEAWYDAVLMQR